MADRFDKFTERARKVLTLAQEEAQRLGHNYIGTEHLLLGLVRESDSVAAMVLAKLDIKLVQVRATVESVIGHGDRVVLGEIGLTPRAKKVIELSVDEARRLNHHYIGTEHLLLGLVREGEGIAAGVLESLGVNLERVRAETTRVLSQELPQQHPEMRGLARRRQNDESWVRRPYGTGFPHSIGSLLGVDGVGQAQDQHGVLITVLSLERYTNGFVINVRIGDGAYYGSPTLDMIADDDLGNTYAADPLGGIGGIASDLWWWRESYVSQTPIAPATTRLDIQVNTMTCEPAARPVPGADDTQIIDGPWSFTIVLEPLI